MSQALLFAGQKTTSSGTSATTSVLSSHTLLMPLLGGDADPQPAPSGTFRHPQRKNSEQYSDIARAAIMSSLNSSPQSGYDTSTSDDGHNTTHLGPTGLMPPPKTAFGRTGTANGSALSKSMPAPHSLGTALTDTPAITPASTAPSSPQMYEPNLLSNTVAIFAADIWNPS